MVTLLLTYVFLSYLFGTGFYLFLLICLFVKPSLFLKIKTYLDKKSDICFETIIVGLFITIPPLMFFIFGLIEIITIVDNQYNKVTKNN
jgi:hypothetical protein